MKLLFSALIKFSMGAGIMGLMLFGSAGTLRWTRGWLLMGILFIPMFLAGLVMMKKNPELLKSRLKSKESVREQSLVIKLSGLMFLAGFLAAGLSFRLDFLLLPRWLSWVAGAVFLTAYGFYGEVLRENTYLSRTIEVRQDQKVVDTGLYGHVRHPMYGVTLVLFLSMPLVLGSVLGFLIFLVYPLIIAKRIRSEEAFLKKELPGYEDYCQRVRFRLIPHVW